MADITGDGPPPGAPTLGRVHRGHGTPPSETKAPDVRRPCEHVWGPLFEKHYGVWYHKTLFFQRCEGCGMVRRV